MARDDFYASLFGVTYSAYMDRPLLSRLIGRAVWGGDSKAYYESMRAITEVPDGGMVVDCPCGAGPALRAVRPNGSVRYIAADLSPSMIRRARKKAKARGLSNVEFVEANASDIPLPADSADLFLSYWGLHCFDDPKAAIEEAARILKPGGRLVGSCFVRGRDGLRQRLLVRSGAGDFGQVGTHTDVDNWLAETGFDLATRSRSGPMLFFDARAAA